MENRIPFGFADFGFVFHFYVKVFYFWAVFLLLGLARPSGNTRVLTYAIFNLLSAAIIMTYIKQNAAKNTHYIKKSFKEKLFKIGFRSKKSGNAYV